MKTANQRKSILFFLAVTAALTLLVVGVVLAQASGTGPGGTDVVQATVGSAFTYQGRLDKSGNPVNDTCSFQFELYTAASGGSVVGSTVTKTGVAVTDGVFTTELDFGSNAFKGDARYLQIAVKCTGDSSYTPLNGRVALNAAPYALNLRPGATVEGSDTANRILGAVNTATTGTGAGLYGEANASGAAGVAGWNLASGGGYAVYGNNTASTGTPYGVYGIASDNGSATSYGVYGKSNSSVGTGVGGIAPQNGVYGEASNSSGATWGVYGKSNSASGYGVYSNGNAHVEGQLTWKSVVSYVSVPAAAFKPFQDGYTFTNNGHTLVPGNASSNYLAQVQLPHGANISNFTFYWTDGATANGSASLYRIYLDGTESLMASADTLGGGPGNSTTGSSSATTISWPAIDNSQYAYYIWLNLPKDTDGTVDAHGVVIEYTIDQPY